MTEAAPFFADVADAPEGGTAHWLKASDGMRLRAGLWSGGSRGTAVILPGRTEYIEKYGRVIRQFTDRNLAVAVIDWRGQGLSDRYPANPLLGHVEDFRDYQHDVAALLDLLERRDLPRPFYLVCHSMGGCIGLRTLLERADFHAAIFSAPMWHLRMKSATRELTARLTQLANLVGFGTRLTPGASPVPTPTLGFEDNALTSDRETFAWALRQITEHPELSLGGPSMQWTRAALSEMARLYIAPLPNMPVLAFCGSAETVVSTSVIRKQVGGMRDGELVICDGARHEIFMERPEIQAEVWHRIDAFLARVAERKSSVAQAPVQSG